MLQNTKDYSFELTIETVAGLCQNPTMERVDETLIALRRILRAVDLFGRELAQSVGLTAVQFRVLQIVAERDHCTAKEISQRMRVSQAAVTSLVDRLVSRGMVVREKSEVDRRQINIVTTPAGRETIAGAPDPLQQRFVQKFDNLDEWEQSMLVAALQRVATMLEAEDIDASPVLYHGEIRRSS
jgi:DNA-binding MarR family transcriptional regulator